MGMAMVEVNMRTYTTAANELATASPGDHVTLTTWKLGEGGSGMEEDGTVTGILRKKGKMINCPGCATVWQEVVMGPNN